MADNSKISIVTNDYSTWKKNSLQDAGYFIVFNGFLENNLLKNISGGALKLYIFLGISADNYTGESFYKIETIANYFEVSTRTISNWIKELEKLNLIYRSQIKFNSVSHTFLKPYFAGIRGRH